MPGSGPADVFPRAGGAEFDLQLADADRILAVVPIDDTFEGLALPVEKRFARVAFAKCNVFNSAYQEIWSRDWETWQTWHDALPVDLQDDSILNRQGPFGTWVLSLLTDRWIDAHCNAAFIEAFVTDFLADPADISAAKEAIAFEFARLALQIYSLGVFLESQTALAKRSLSVARA